MPIEIVKEAKGPLPKTLADFEDCFRCGSPTPYWSKTRDIPVCPDCALIVNESDLPTKEQWAAS